ncbi:transcriptional regulator, TetR family [Paenibacillus algorifonticola]|uniref:Transcriptional regulator, TetR family n=1 Tax=Paenibacillus algorifonticola TaxID=684063 RepID=A0A1I2EEH3_9BACL|nr:TetR/AcrR family transcriptional regulator [Paenibacillus algorifonticola]SFE91057.1 transcriptional regulator, TetR family [Paenibacillus algorifonticola]
MRILKDPEERKNEILDAAEMLFYTKGYNKTTINDILQEIGIAKGTFYYYFKSKEEVMDAIIMRIVAADVASAKSIASSSELPTLVKLFQILMAQKPKNGDRKELLLEQFHQVGNAEMHQKSLVQTIIHLTPVLTAVIEQGIEERIFQTEYPKETVEFLIVSSTFLFDEGLFEWQAEEMIQKAKAFIHVMETTLGAKKGSFDFIFEMLTNSD